MMHTLLLLRNVLPLLAAAWGTFGFPITGRAWEEAVDLTVTPSVIAANGAEAETAVVGDGGLRVVARYPSGSGYVSIAIPLTALPGDLGRVTFRVEGIFGNVRVGFRDSQDVIFSGRVGTESGEEGIHTIDFEEVVAKAGKAPAYPLTELVIGTRYDNQTADEFTISHLALHPVVQP